MWCQRVAAFLIAAGNLLLALSSTCLCCSIVAVVDKCLEEDLAVFKATVQDIVDELEVRIYCSALPLPIDNNRTRLR